MSKKVLSLVERELGCGEEAVTEDADLIADLGADSLDSVEIVMAIEEEFRVDISDEEAEKWETPGDIIRYLEGAGVAADQEG